MNKPKVSREQLPALIAQLAPCIIGMEACSGAHHFARLFRAHSHSVKLMSPKFVTPYREWLGEAIKATGCQLHAYVQMTNHVHLLLTPPEPATVSRLMISLGRRYVQYVNKTYRRTGTLWDERATLSERRQISRERSIREEVPKIVTRILEQGRRATRRAVDRELGSAGLDVRRQEAPFVWDLVHQAIDDAAVAVASGNN